MKAVILAGGYGTRLSEETAVLPKPMIEIGGRPQKWTPVAGQAPSSGLPDRIFANRCDKLAR